MQIDDFEIDEVISDDLESMGVKVETTGEINDLVERLFNLKERKSSLNEEIKDIDKQIGSIEYTLMNRMDELGMEKLSTSAGSVSKKTALYPNILDFNALVTFCVEQNRFDFLQKRVNSAPFKEFFEQYNEYPSGLDGFYKDTLNSRRKR